ncbi:MAG: DUF1549 domain-containing protein [Pirellulaceae bacterium]|nr:DUF1549 domain-containing protein [Pirellulaceae bacterium]
MRRSANVKQKARFVSTCAYVGLLSLMLSATASAQRNAASVAKDYGFPQVQRINAEIRQQWSESGLVPSGPADDGKWCRRVYLDVLGRIPTAGELTAFVSNRDPDKKNKLLQQLLHDDRYTEEYARNWTTIWSNVLIGRSGGLDRNSLTSREGMQKYLRDSFARNKPYDRMVHELITASGVNVPGREGFNGAVNFLADKVNDEKATLATSATSRIFLGLQVQCTQCHNHPFNEWKQQKFWEFNAFFRQTRMLRRFLPGTRDLEFAELVDEDFEGEFGNPEDAVIFYELRNGLTVAAYPTFVDGQTASEKSGFVEDIVRREELARFVVNSEFLGKMAVNRLWAHFMGYGFTKPIDDLGPHNPPTHPALLEYLGQQFRENSYDLKQLIHWIALSETYSLSSSVVRGNESDDPTLGEPPKFSHFYLRQMQAEQLYESLLVATAADESRGSYEEQEEAKAQWLRQFVTAFGTDEGDESTTFNGSIPQVLMMFNSDLIKQAINTDTGTFLAQLADSPNNAREKIDHLFLAGLSRRATANETGIAGKLYAARQADMKATLQDLWWAILNSNEFIFVH